MKNSNAFYKLRDLRMGGINQINIHKPFFKNAPQDLIIDLNDIVDEKRELERCVLLGFTRDGNHLLSYRRIVSIRNIDTVSHYSFQLWTFQFGKKSFKIFDAHLFGQQSISDNCELSITVMQDVDENLFVIHGNGIEEEGINYQSNHMTIFPSPITDLNSPRRIPSTMKESIHFSYLTQSPFPKFDPKISFLSPNVLIFNTGSCLHCLTFSIPSHFLHEDRREWERKNEDVFSFSGKEWSTDLQKGLKPIKRWKCTQQSNIISIEFISTKRTNNYVYNNPFETEGVETESFGIKSHDCFAIEKFWAVRNQHYKQLGYLLIDYDIELLDLIEEESLVCCYTNGIFRKDNEFQNGKNDVLLILTHILSLDLQTGEHQILHNHQTTTKRSELKKTLLLLQGSWRGIKAASNPPKWHVKTPFLWNNATVQLGHSIPVLFHPKFPIAICIKEDHPT
eukprot:TRINITY_DN6689_c0_g1_i1.p1 TRINITY_DN6689_c0_g1~~TRINITY_DN6689_c0_g1_i1.p1  ORF type:complete len:451 (+),score=140.05 TRINITY_DN6689_c0_g1_i1:91-1443(+)